MSNTAAADSNAACMAPLHLLPTGQPTTPAVAPLQPVKESWLIVRNSVGSWPLHFCDAAELERRSTVTETSDETEER